MDPKGNADTVDLRDAHRHIVRGLCRENGVDPDKFFMDIMHGEAQLVDHASSDFPAAERQVIALATGTAHKRGLGEPS